VPGILAPEPARPLTAMDEVPYVWLLNSWLPLPPSDTAASSGPPADVFPLPPFAAGLRRHSVSWVVLHRYLCADPAVNTPYYCPAFGSYDSTRTFLTSTLGRPMYDRDGLVAWHVADAPAAAAPDPTVELGAGWGYGLDLPQNGEPRRVAVGSDARLALDATRARDVHLGLRASSVLRP